MFMFIRDTEYTSRIKQWLKKLIKNLKYENVIGKLVRAIIAKTTESVFSLSKSENKKQIILSQWYALAERQLERDFYVNYHLVKFDWLVVSGRTHTGTQMTLLHRLHYYSITYKLLYAHALLARKIQIYEHFSTSRQC